MIQIDDDIYKVTSKKIFVGKFTKNCENGYNICIKLEFSNDLNKIGYLNIDAGFEKDCNINLFVNKEFCGVPFDNDNQYISFEMFDTKRFIDTQITSPIKIRTSEIKKSKIEVHIELNDELVKINFLDFFNIIDK